LPYGYSNKASRARPGPGWRQSARMSKITNDGLTRSGTGCLIAVPRLMATVVVKGLVARDSMRCADYAAARCLSLRL